MLGAAPDSEVQQLILLRTRHFSGVVAKPNPQTSPWSCDLATKANVYILFQHKGRRLHQSFSKGIFNTQNINNRSLINKNLISLYRLLCSVCVKFLCIPGSV